MELSKIDEFRMFVAYKIAQIYQIVGRYDRILFWDEIMGFLSYLCKTIDPIKVREGYINPAMLEAILETIEKTSGETREQTIAKLEKIRRNEELKSVGLPEES